MSKKAFIILTLAIILIAPVTAQRNSRGKGNGKGPGSGFNEGMMASMLLSLPNEAISTEEETGLAHMREEEKLARDVYLALYDTWQLSIFRNIASSEQRHMDAIKVILDKYSLPDPVSTDTIGIFTDPNIQDLYYQLVQAGSVSLVEAIKVGATIEDLDIFDLKNFLLKSDNIDIRTLYQNLMKGSRNHLRVFATQLTIYNIAYSAQYLTQQEVDDIINSQMERGVVDENGNPIYGNIGW